MLHLESRVSFPLRIPRGKPRQTSPGEIESRLYPLVMERARALGLDLMPQPATDGFFLLHTVSFEGLNIHLVYTEGLYERKDRTDRCFRFHPFIKSLRKCPAAILSCWGPLPEGGENQLRCFVVPSQYLLDLFPPESGANKLQVWININASQGSSARWADLLRYEDSWMTIIDLGIEFQESRSES